MLRQVHGGPYTYLKLKMPGPNSIITVSSSFEQVYAYSCQHFELSTVITNSAEIKRFHETMVEDAPDRNEPTSSSAFRQTEDTMAVEVDPNDPTKNLRIGTQLPTKYESVLIDFLHAYHDAFAWKPSDMLGTLREVAEHELRIMLGSKPMHQRLRHFDYGRCRAISEEIAKLLAASFIKEVYHSDWLLEIAKLLAALFSGCLLWLSPDCDERVRPAHDLFTHPIRLLRQHAMRPEKCWCHLPALHAEMFHQSDQFVSAAQPARAAETHSRRLRG
jgi:hypothetical protein